MENVTLQMLWKYAKDNQTAQIQTTRIQCIFKPTDNAMQD